jgi:hypothetical protein
LVEKFLGPEINLSPKAVLSEDGSVKHPPMDNHSMGTIFEELVHPQALANTAKHLAFTHCWELNHGGMVDTQIAALESGLFASSTM